MHDFVERCRELSDLRSVLDCLSWDQEVVMPPEGGGGRARQLATLAGIHHRKQVDPIWPELLESLSGNDLGPSDGAALREARRDYERAVKVPEGLVRELAETASLAYDAWVQARKDSDFEAFAPWLKKVMALKKREAECLSEGGSLYDALLDEYEPGMTSARLSDLFADIRPRLSGLVERIQGSGVRPDARLLKGPFPQDAQREFGRRVLNAMGFQWRRGRLDESPHPFCTGIGIDDVRLTTRYSEEDFGQSFFGMVHECGHGLYEQGLDAQRRGLPDCRAVSLGVHESQSRLWENFIARSRPFWEHWHPVWQGVFGESADAPFEAFLLLVNRVEPSLIRVEADEVTYGLHVLLRFDIERLLIDGDLGVDDLPEVWNRRMKDDLGVEPRNEAEGVLQDTHWSQGLVGYFPTYLLGNLYAAQLYARVREEFQDFDERLRAGDLAFLAGWLREGVHRVGSVLQAEDLIQRASGQPLRSLPFLDYLDSKYEALYRL